MNVLIVFETVPDVVNLYTMDHLTDEEVKTLIGAAGNYVNLDDSEELDAVVKWMDSGRATLLDSAYHATGPFDMVVVCGFVM